MNTAHATLLLIATSVYKLFFIVVTYTMLVFVFVAIKNIYLSIYSDVISEILKYELSVIVSSTEKPWAELFKPKFSQPYVNIHVVFEYSVNISFYSCIIVVETKFTTLGVDEITVSEAELHS